MVRGMIEVVDERDDRVEVIKVMKGIIEMMGG